MSTLAIAAVLPALFAAQSDDISRLEVRAGVGTDISLGLAVGGRVSYLVGQLGAGGPVFDVGADIYYANSTEESDNGINIYEEETTVGVFIIRGNALWGYDPSGGTYLLAGAGVGAITVDWVESSATDSSLGPALPGGGSQQEASGTVGGLLTSVGLGTVLGGGFDVRLELPIFILLGDVGEATGIIPTVTVTGGLRF